MTATESFEKSFEYFQDNKELLIQKYRGKIIAVYVDRVLGEFESKKDAFIKVPKKFKVENGAFLIKDCSEQNAQRVYHSKVAFGKD